jgi:RNA polymerase sigma-70 factor, ECF subfamily
MMSAHEPLPGRSAERDSLAEVPRPPRCGDRSLEQVLLQCLRRGDEAAFSELVEMHHASMIRVARLYVESAAAAEEVAQEAWLGVLEGLRGFQGRCTLKAWIFSIVSNCARSRGARDKRTVPLSSLARADEEGGASVEPERFLDEDHPRWPGHWSRPPQPWEEDELVSRETLAAIQAAMETLPPMQRAVMTMRDVEGLGAEEACQVLQISEANQRVLLHRARSKVRKVLEGYLREGEVSP